MCLTPSVVNGVKVACRACRICDDNRVNTWVGRCLAEKQFNKKTFAVTFTYADRNTDFDSVNNDWKLNPVHAQQIVYKDFQLMLKRLRLEYEVRFIVAAEHGTLRNRVHFHAILFFPNEYPDVDFRKEDGTNKERVFFKYWPHGHCYFDENIDWKAFAYTLKYVLKDRKSNSAHNHFAYTTGCKIVGKESPVIGGRFFEELAQRYVDNGLKPQHWFYQFSDITNSNGKLKNFYMTGKVRDIFARTYLKLFEQKYPLDNLPILIEEYFEDELDEKLLPPWWPHLGKKWKRCYTEYEQDTKFDRFLNAKSYVDEFGTGKSKAVDYYVYETTYEGLPLVLFDYRNELICVSENETWHVKSREQKREILKKATVLSRLTDEEHLSKALVA